MSTFLLVCYAVFLLGLGALALVAAGLIVFHRIEEAWHWFGRQHVERGKRLRDEQLKSDADIWWQKQYRESEQRSASLIVENNHLRKKLYPGKC